MEKQSEHYANIKITPLEHSEVEIEGEIPANILEAKRKEAIKKLTKDAEVPGFRKGKVPENVLVEKLGEGAILHEAAELALGESYPQILMDHKIDAIGRPSVSITKLALGNPIGFKIKTAILPDIKLADYKAIAKKEMSGKEKKEDIEASDKEVGDAIEQVHKNFASHDKLRKQQEAAASGRSEEAKEDEGEETLPELTDEFVKKLGDFKDVEDFKKKLKENISKEKEAKAKDKKRGAVIEKLIEKSTIDVPEVLVESELSKMTAQFKDEVTRAGLTFEDYLKRINKTEEEIRKEWREPAVKRTKTQLIFNKIATEEKIEADKEALDHETKHLLEHYPDANPETVRVYIETQLINNKVLELLEKQGHDTNTQMTANDTNTESKDEK